MATLKVTTRGQVTFRKDVLRHLGIKPGDKIRLELLPDGRASVSADKPAGSWKDLQGFLDGRTNGAELTIEDISEAIAEAAAEAGTSDRS